MEAAEKKKKKKELSLFPEFMNRNILNAFKVLEFRFQLF